MLMKDVIRIRAGRIEIAAALVLYGVYEVVRGFGGDDFVAAHANTADIVALERSLGIFWEQGVQSASSSVPGLARILGVLYIGLHFLGTVAFLVWVHRRRPGAFAAVRNTLVASTGLALVGYLAYPAAPPRLSGLGFTDTVTESAGINLSSDLLGALYNPIAAVPSLHFGYALIVGVALALLAQRRWVRVVGALYAPAMLYIIVATGNHFFVDAALGGLVVAVGFGLALGLERIPLPGGGAPVLHRRPQALRTARAL